MLENARRNHRRLAGFTFTLLSLASLFPLVARAQVVHTDIDYEASGYVTPAGMAPPSMYQGPVQPVGYFPSENVDSYGGYGSSCDVDGCDVGGGCSGACGGGFCGGGACGGSCGMFGCLSGGCGYGSGLGDGGLCGLRHFCLFCRGSGCEACQMFGNGQILGMLQALLPYSEAGLCSQRWYDVSAEALFLTHSSGGPSGAVTSQGIGGPAVLSFADSDAGGDLEAGVRLSGALIFGAGGNIEATWMGGNRWDSSASVFDNNAGLFSFISDFGNFPVLNSGGFDDTDRSLVQSIGSSSKFDSVELNYRRRTVGPYCRFQGSWLFGLRYIRFDDSLLYSALGQDNNTVNANLPRFFSSSDQVENRMFGGQIGGDLWWNIIPGVSAGVGVKGAWLKNDIDRHSLLSANSLGPMATAGTRTFQDGDQDGTIMGEFEAKLIYRLSHSWTVRTAYYAIAIDEVVFGSVDVDNIRNFVQAAPAQTRGLQTDSLVVQGFSIGAEYTW